MLPPWVSFSLPMTPMDMGARLRAPEQQTLVDLLLAIPDDFEVKRDRTPLRSADF